MKTVMNKELVLSTLKKVVSYGVIVGALVLGFIIGRYIQNYPPKESNSYLNIYSTSNVSIAVNEGNELMLIDRASGNYQMYSDSIGMTIFKMYSNRIYQNANLNE
jgi:predicted permease